MLLQNLLWTVMVSIFLGISTAQKVSQEQSTMTGQEGETVTLNCKYETSATSYTLFWYKQLLLGEMIFLIRQDSYGQVNTRKDRYLVNLQKTEKFINLTILASQLGDSAMYFCALREDSGLNKLTFGKGTRIIIKPNIQNPQPALYQLRSPKSSNTSVCLLTDFGFYNGSIKNETVTGSEATVLEMMTMESKSYGAVTWGSKSNFTCTDAFRKDMFDFNQFSGSKCNSSHAEQGFETDRDLNLMNLSLIVLRIIFLKTVGFNLLMTLRLWSN